MNKKEKEVEAPGNDISRYGVDPVLEMCMGEVAGILKKHGLEGQIGLSILHNHFEIGPEEIMFESVDPINRELRLNPVIKADVDPDVAFVSVWEPVSKGAILMCPRTDACHQILPERIKTPQRV